MPPGAMMPAPLGTMWQLVPIDTTTPNMKSKEKSEKEKQEGGGQQEKKQTPAPKQDKQGKQQPVTIYCSVPPHVSCSCTFSSFVLGTPPAVSFTLL